MTVLWIKSKDGCRRREEVRGQLIDRRSESQMEGKAGEAGADESGGGHTVHIISFPTSQGDSRDSVL
jgi:hypothetical protein